MVKKARLLQKQFYADQGVDVHYVGHPLVHVIQDFDPEIDFKSKNNLVDKQILAILPGSRKQEISKMLPVYISAALKLKDKFHIVIAAAPNLDVSFYTALLHEGASHVSILEDNTYNLLFIADLAIVTSGTATLETALFKVPQVICYKTSTINYAIGKRLVDLKYISLVNLILDQGLITELIQEEANLNQISDALTDTISKKGRIPLFLTYLWSKF